MQMDRLPEEDPEVRDTPRILPSVFDGVLHVLQRPNVPSTGYPDKYRITLLGITYSNQVLVTVTVKVIIVVFCRDY